MKQEKGNSRKKKAVLTDFRDHKPNCFDETKGNIRQKKGARFSKQIVFRSRHFIVFLHQYGRYDIRLKRYACTTSQFCLIDRAVKFSLGSLSNPDDDGNNNVTNLHI